MNADNTICLSAFIGVHRRPFLVFLVIEPVPDNRLDQQMIRGLRHAHPNAEVEFPQFFPKSISTAGRNCCC